MRLAAGRDGSRRAVPPRSCTWNRWNPNRGSSKLGWAARVAVAVAVDVAVAGAVAFGSLLSAAPAAAAAAADRVVTAAYDAGAGTAGTGEAALDSVVQEVLRMLHAKVSEPVIVHWLDTSGQQGTHGANWRACSRVSASAASNRPCT